MHQNNISSQEFLKSPMDEFFCDYSSEEAKKILWVWLKATVNENFSSLPKRERSNLIYFYEILVKFIENMEAFNQQFSVEQENIQKGRTDV